MTSPRLSVGLPVYNGENFLAASIESVLRQDFTDFELIISDNGSTDRTAEICARYAAADPRVRYHRSETNQGGAWNFNRVFELSTAPLFKWQAHDDVCLPGMFRRGVETFERAPAAVVVVFPRTELVDEAGRILTHFLPEHMETRRPQPHQRLADVLRSMTMVRAQFGFVRAAALRQTRLFDRMIAADFILFGELAMLGELWEMPETLFQRRIHAGISTRANTGTDQLMQWWDPTQRKYRGLLSPMLRLGGEYFRSIRRLPLPFGEKLRCALTVVSVWFVRELRNTGGRWRQLARLRFAPRAA
jgi:glycosyltransferase involved in cell wall biosynthesis